MKNMIFGVLVSLGFLLGGLGCSSEDVVDLPNLPPVGGGGQNTAAGEKNFSGRWVSQCQEDSQQPFKSYQVELEFADNQMTMTTRLFLEDECFAENMRVETAGEIELSNGDSRDNMVTFTEDGKDSVFFRSAGPGDSFIITRMKDTAEEANLTPADIVLYRPAEWQDLQAQIFSSLPVDSIQIEKGIYQNLGGGQCEFIAGFGKPTEDWQVLYIDFRNPGCGGEMIKFTCFNGSSECRAQGSTDYRLEQISETQFQIRLAFQSKTWSYEKVGE